MSDDALKDEDNAAWVMQLAPTIRTEWLRRIGCIRVVDRLAENERFEPAARRFEGFVSAFRQFSTGTPPSALSPYETLLTQIHASWPTPANDDGAVPAREAWDGYVAALGDYHGHPLVIGTLAEHDDMLYRLSGRIFQLVPFLTRPHWEAIGELGRLDQFWNNVRDLAEDAEHGICYLPSDVLARFGVARDELVQGRAASDPRYSRMMRYWLDEHLPSLKARSEPFATATGLHSSLQTMRAWTMRRHARVERVFRGCGFDPRVFRERYWTEVRAAVGAAGPT